MAATAVMSLCTLIATLVVTAAADDLDGFVPGFIIEQIYIPPNCTHRAREGDYMYQHYVGTFADGTQFDSRQVNQITDNLIEMNYFVE